jgi:hypothetical protein
MGGAFFWTAVVTVQPKSLESSDLPQSGVSSTSTAPGNRIGDLPKGSLESEISADPAQVAETTTQPSRRRGRLRHPLADRGHDLYETPACAVEALLRAESLPHFLWEPAAGRGAIVRVLREHGHAVIASDLLDYGFPTHFHGRDFLLESKAPAGCQAIVTNSPYKLAEQFVEHALRLVPQVYMLLRLAFLESERRRGILEGRGLVRVHVFRNRLPMMHRADWTGPRASSSTAYAWFVWDRAHTGPATLHRISWSASPSARCTSHPQQEIDQ